MANPNPNPLPADTKWKPGQSGNPGGRPKGVARLAREMTDDGRKAIAVLVDILENGKPAERIQAAKELLDRGFGKAPAFERVEGADPLEQGEVETELARVMDELAAARAKKIPRRPQANPVDGTGANGAASTRR